jgi:hypothetical protein
LPTVEGDARWDGDDDLLVVGNGAAQTRFTPSLQSIAYTTLTGTATDLVGIPPWANQVVLSMQGVSTNGTSGVRVRLGDAGGPENAGYTTGIGVVNATPSATAVTDGFPGPSAVATAVRNGVYIFNRANSSSNIWSCLGIVYDSVNTLFGIIAGVKGTSAAMDRITITTAGGADVFDGTPLASLCWRG